MKKIKIKKSFKMVIDLLTLQVNDCTLSIHCKHLRFSIETVSRFICSVYAEFTCSTQIGQCIEKGFVPI